MTQDHCRLVYERFFHAAVVGVALFIAGGATGCAPEVTAGCLINGDCATGEQCINRKCVVPVKACSIDSNCDEGQVCEQGLCKEDTNVIPTGCRSDEECNATPQTPFCLTTKVCGECRSTADCGDSKKQCSDQHACVFTLGNCGSEADCSAPALANTPHCDTTTNACVGCVDSAQCASGYFCSMGTQKCQIEPTHHCTSDGDCAAPLSHCEFGSGICQECTADNQCASGKSCQNGACVKVGCSIDNDCAGTQVCNATTGICVDCLNSGQCPGSQICQEGVCTTGNTSGCTTNGDCLNSSVGPYCSVGQCVQCITSNNCGSGQTCSGNVCTSGSGGSTYDCNSDAECTSHSDRPVCDTTAGLCVQCSANRDCLGGERCLTHTCQPRAVCQTAFDCPGLVTCDEAGQCLECDTDFDCPDPLDQFCVNGGCYYTPPSLGCQEVIHCLNNCFGSACDYCEYAASSQAVDLYNEVVDCINATCATCGSNAACAACQGDAQDPGGACYRELTACLQN